MSDTSEDLDVSGDSGTVIRPTNYRRTSSPPSPSSTRIKRLKQRDERHERNGTLEDKDALSTGAIQNSRLLPDRNYWTDKDRELYYRSNGNPSNGTSPVSPPVSPAPTLTGSPHEPSLPLRLRTRGFWPDREGDNSRDTNATSTNSSLEAKDSVSNSRLVPDRNYWTDKDSELYYRSTVNRRPTSPVFPSGSPALERERASTATGSPHEPSLPLRLHARSFWPDREGLTNASTAPTRDSTNAGWANETYEESEEDLRIRSSCEELKRLIEAKRLPQSQILESLKIALFRVCQRDKEKAIGKIVTARYELKRRGLHSYHETRTSNHIRPPLYDLYRLPHPGLSTPATTSLPPPPPPPSHSFGAHPCTPRPLPLYGPGFYVESVLQAGQRYYTLEK